MIMAPSLASSLNGEGGLLWPNDNAIINNDNDNDEEEDSNNDADNTTNNNIHYD